MKIETVDLNQYLSDPPGTLYYWSEKSIGTDRPICHIKIDDKNFISFCTSDSSSVWRNQDRLSFYFEPYNKYAFNFFIEEIDQEILDKINFSLDIVERKYKIQIPRIYSKTPFKKLSLSISVLKRNI